MKKTATEIRRELAELEQEHQMLLDQPIRKAHGPLAEAPKGGTMMTGGRAKRIRELEKRIKGLQNKLKSS